MRLTDLNLEVLQDVNVLNVNASSPLFGLIGNVGIVIQERMKG